VRGYVGGGVEFDSSHVLVGGGGELDAGCCFDKCCG